MISLLLILIPFTAGLSLFLFKNARLITSIALTASFLAFILAVYVYLNFDPSGGIQFAMQQTWIRSIDVRLSLGIDGTGLTMILLTTILSPLIIMTGIGRTIPHAGPYYGLILIMQAAMTAVFLTFNALLFYVFWELSMIPAYFILLLWGDQYRKPVSIRFYIYTISGSLLMLTGMIIIYFNTPGIHSFEWWSFCRQTTDAAMQNRLFLLLFAAFAVKMPLFPFHTWQPPAYSSAPPQGSMLLAGLMSKMGLFGAIRWLLPVLPAGVEHWRLPVIILSIAGIIYGSIIAFRQKDLKKIVAFSSLSHMGLMAAGIFSGLEFALKGALFQAFVHGILVAGLFYIIDLIEQQLNTKDIDRSGGLKLSAPGLAGFFMIIILGSAGLPLTGGFVGEFLIIAGLFKINWLIAAIAGLTIIFGAVYLLFTYQKVMLGEKNEFSSSFTDIGLKEKLILVPIAILIIITGLFPGFILRLGGSSVQNIIHLISAN